MERRLEAAEAALSKERRGAAKAQQRYRQRCKAMEDELDVAREARRRVVKLEAQLSRARWV